MSDDRNAALAVYERYGLIALPFGVVGQFFFRAGPTTDSTNVLFIAFGGGADPIDVQLARGGAPVHSYRIQGAVSQEAAMLAPGTYHLTLGMYSAPVVVPRMGPNSLATPILMRQSDALPRATAIIGRDTAVDVALEAYGTSRAPMTLSAPGWRDTVTLERHGNVSSGVIRVPLSRLGLGETTLVFARGRDSVSAPAFVGFGPSVNAVSFDQLLDVLRYFPPAEPLRRSPGAWATVWEQSRQPLLEYLDRVRQANKRYWDEYIPGWKTDRGSVFLRLGDPDQVFVEPDTSFWVYTRYFGRVQLVHEGQRWRLTPQGHAMLDTLVARARDAR